MLDDGLKEPLKRFDETFSGEDIVLDRLRASRPDLAWFIAPEIEQTQRVYSINDNPNTCRDIAIGVAGFIIAVLVLAVAGAILMGGN